MTKVRQSERDEAIESLRETLKPGDTVFTVLRSVSRSGMQRKLNVYVMESNEPRRLTWNVARAIDFTYDRKAEALKVDGCGMDVGFEVVYHLGRVLFPNGFACTGDRCPSNDHSNGDRNHKPHMHTGDGGYALHHRWM